jgi:hypothetical protein
MLMGVNYFVLFFIDKLIVVQGARLLRDERSGETFKAQSGKGLTARPAESEQPGTEINHF